MSLFVNWICVYWNIFQNFIMNDKFETMRNNRANDNKRIVFILFSSFCLFDVVKFVYNCCRTCWSKFLNIDKYWNEKKIIKSTFVWNIDFLINLLYHCDSNVCRIHIFVNVSINLIINQSIELFNFLWIVLFFLIFFSIII